MIARQLANVLRADRSSVLLLGPRQTGKSTLLATLDPALTINLAHEATYLEFARNPRELEERLAPLRATRGVHTVLIDEIQRLPSLLNTVQVLLDQRERRFRFLLSGSSARKLRRGHGNLLPGRVHTYHLGPLTSRELHYGLDTKQALATGTLPGVHTDADPTSRRKTLRSYAATYLREEIQAENLMRNLEGFARFLQVAGEWAGHHLDLSKLAAAAHVPRQSTVRFFEILEDTLIVQRAEPFTKSPTRRLVQHPKYWFFDVGVRNGLLGDFAVSGERIGALFEHLVYGQLTAGAAARDCEMRLSTYRTEHGAEVDVIVELDRTVWAVELKASRTVSPRDLRGLRSFAELYGKRHQAAVWYLGDERREIDGIPVVPWQEGLRNMGL